MSPELVTMLIFVTVVFTFIGVFSLLADLLLGDRERLHRRVDAEFRLGQPVEEQHSALFKNVPGIVQEGEEAAPNLRKRFEMMVEQSGLKIDPNRLLTLMAICGLVLTVIGVLLRLNIELCVVAGLMGAAVPYLHVHGKYRARQAKLLAQLPDAFDLMARVVRTGQTMTHALASVAAEFNEPISGEFSRSHEQIKLGLAPEIALKALAMRTQTLEIKIFVLAVLVQEQTGGNLAELFDNLSLVIRERFKVKARVSSLTAEGRLSAMILLMMPVVLFAALFMVNPGYVKLLFQYPTLITITLVAELLGGLWIYRIINFDF